MLPFFSPCHAHKVSSASAILEFDTEKERSFLLSIATQVESSGDDLIDDQISPEEAARSFVEGNIEVLINEEPQPISLVWQIVNESDENTPENLRRLAVIVDWKGKLPPSGKELLLFMRETAEMNLILVVKKNGVVARRAQVMLPGEFSRAENIEPLMKENPFETEVATEKPPTGQGSVDSSLFPAPSGETAARGSGFMKRFRAGVTASLQPFFLPVGLLAVFLIAAATPRSLLVSFILFVVAQSLGTSLAALGVMSPLPWSTALAQACLFLLAADNLLSQQHRAWRYLPGMVGAFAAGNLVVQVPAFGDMGSPPVPLSQLVAFQAGIEAVALLIALLGGLMLSLSARGKLVHSLVMIPLSIVFAGVATYFFLENFTSLGDHF